MRAYGSLAERPTRAAYVCARGDVSVRAPASMPDSVASLFLFLLLYALHKDKGRDKDARETRT